MLHVVYTILGLIFFCATLFIPINIAEAVTVSPTVETGPCQSDTQDVCDDSTIWIHPTDPSQSVVIGDDKHGGIVTWGLDGKQIQYIDQTKLMNNIDLRYNFPFNGSKVVLVVVGNEGDGTLNFYTVNPSSRMLEARGSYKLNTSAPYGGCMYHSPVSGKYYYFVNWKSGVWQQVELTANGTTINGAVVRQHDAGGQTEGCVADDVHKYYYIGEEAVGVWRYGAEPGDGTSRLQINSSGEITPDTEGMSLYYRSDGGGYLIISSQGDSNLIVYERKPSSPTAKNAFIGKIQIGASGSIDAVSGTDGLDVTNFPLGSAFPKGMLVTHDQTNTGSSTSNHKYTPFERVAVALNLQMDTSWDPRLVGSGGSPQPTPTNTPGATTPTLTSGGVCPKKSSGDANCDQLVNMTDFEIFRKEYLQLISTRTSDFDSTGTVQMGDFEIWRRTIFAI